MKKLRTLFYILLLCVISISVSAQSQGTNIMKILTSSTWEHTYELSKDVIFKCKYIFTSTLYKEVFTYNGEKSENSFTYYLNDKPEFEFDDSKVGKEKNGKYIIIKNKFSEVSVRKIITLTEAMFEYSLISKPSSGRNNQDDQTIVCKGIPKR